MSFFQIFLYIVAALCILLGLYIAYRYLFAKKNTHARSEEAQLFFDPATNHPILPRQSRLTYFKKIGLIEEDKEDTQQAQATVQTVPAQTVTSAVETQQQALMNDGSLVQNTAQETIREEQHTALYQMPYESNKAETAVVETPQATMATNMNENLQLNPHTEVHAVETLVAENTAIENIVPEAEETVKEEQEVMEFCFNLAVGKEILGESLFKYFERYGIQFGEMNYFHRYEQDEEGNFHHAFSVANRSTGRTEPFNIHTFSQEKISSLAFFITFPHYDAIKGYDMLMSTMNRLAKELNARITDTHRNEFTIETESALREAIADYVAAVKQQG